MREKLNRADWLFLGACAVIFAVGLTIGIAYFDRAFPEAAIDFKHDRRSSGGIAEKFLAEQRFQQSGYRHAAQFTHDDTAKIFLERQLGLVKANELTRRDVKIWFWRHRWFRPLQVEEAHVDVAPTGEIVSFAHKIPEDQASPALPKDAEQRTAEAFLRRVGINPAKLQFISRSEQKRPKRTDVTYVWEAQDIRPAGASYRYTVVLHGDRIGSFSQFLKVPDQWIRDYSELRSKNLATAVVDQVFLTVTMIAALVIFIVRMRRGDVQLRFALGSGIIGMLLVIGVSLNEFPSALADYDTTQSYGGFLTQQILFPVLKGIGLGILLAVIVGSGEALYRQRLPQQLAMPRAVSRRALTSKRVFKGFVLGYTLFAAFLAYQVVFYLAATRFGAWSPADIPYSSILNSAFPWAAVLFMGFFPAFSEEFLSRAFSIPFFERWVKSPWLAIVISGFIWGFGHAAYPNQPFYIRGVEVGVAGVIMGFLMYRFGILGLLIWHYTVDALYTALLLFRSNNPYYIFSAGLASLIFVIPMIASIVLYIRNRGFIPDEDLSNAAIGSVAAPTEGEEMPAAQLTAPAIPLTVPRIALFVGTLAAAVAVVMLARPTLDDIINYRITRQRAIELARRHLAEMKIGAIPSRIVALPTSGFRTWDPESHREDGGGPSGYDDVALGYLLHRGATIARVLGIEREQIEAATWSIRFFEPMQKEEIFVEVDPRTSRVVGMHKYREEAAPGAALEQNAAESLGRGELARYQLDTSRFDLKEALVYQQPRRRDWLFHYEEKTPLLAEAYRRASVRVTGNTVSQFAKTIKVPERDRREAEKETALNTILVVAKVLAVIILLGLVIYGTVAAVRERRFAWRPATRLSLIAAPLALVSIFLQRDLMLGTYDTAWPWETFSIILIVGIILRLAFEVGVVWISVAILETAIPAARRVIGREGTRRFGAAAAVAAVTVVSIFVMFGAINKVLPAWLPRYAPVEGLGVPDVVAIPAPSLAILWQAIVTTLAMAAAVAGVAAALKSAPANRRWIIHALVAGSVLLVSLDSSIRPAQIPLMLLIAGATVALLYVAAKFILRDNLLAYPLTFFTISMLSGASSLLRNERGDLQINAWVLIAVGLGVLLWYALGSRLVAGEPTPEPAAPQAV